MPVAIVGVSALFPGSTEGAGFWRDILAGRDLMTDVPPAHWLIEDYYDPDPNAPDKTYARRGAFLPKLEFDPLEFGVPPSIIPATDSAQLLALIVAQRVLEDASQGQFASMDRDRISVILGVTSAQELLGTMVSRLQKPVWIKALRESGIAEDAAQKICERMAASYVPWQESSFPGLLGNVVAGRIANRFDLRGTNAVTDAACASTLSAFSMGLNELALGQADLVISGGVDTMNGIFMYMCFSKTPALSITGDCRPFSDSADGTMLGEGMAMFALKRLADAERDGDRIYAVIRGLGSSSDGRSKSVYAPLAEGQARALRRAYQNAGYGADSVELVEAHGTGTKAGDVAEFEGLRAVFDETGRAERQWCALGSVKSQIGHTKAAAGAAGLFKAVMALHHKVLPPTIKIERPNPKLAVDASPFYLNTVSRPWFRDATHPRRASVSSFGFGGSNFHITLEEYTGPGPRAWRLRAEAAELVLVTGADGTEVAARCRTLAIEAAAKGLVSLARASQESFCATDRARLAIMASTGEDLAAKLAQAADMVVRQTAFSTPTGMYYATGACEGAIAFLFPGQGSQYPGMGADVAMAFDAARAVWDAAASRRYQGRAVHEVVHPRPAFSDAGREAQQRELTSTEWAQPAIGLASLALLEILRAVGVRACCTGGHSFGEVTALCAAGVIVPAALVDIARRRGELMREAAAVPGAMTAVARPIETVRELLARHGAQVVLANHNHPAQVVLSGDTAAIAAIEEKLQSEGVSFRRLPVATAFHSPLVAPSRAPFGEFLGSVTFAAPKIDVYSNALAAPYAADAQTIRSTLTAQIALPVRFVEMIEAMYARGVRIFVEVGPGAVLTDLVGRILGKRPHRAIALDRQGRNGVSLLHEGLGRLAVAGVDVDFAPLWASYARPAEKKSKPAMTLAINGNNYGKPYPPPGGAKDLPRPNPVAAPAAPSAPAPASLPAPPAREPAPPAPAASMSADADRRDAYGAWVGAYQEAQRQTAEAHAAYQRSMAETHMAFLRVAENSLSGLGAMLGAGPLAAPMPWPVATAMPTPPIQTVSAPAPNPAPILPLPPAAAEPVTALPADAPSASVVEAPSASVVEAPRAPVVEAPRAPVDLKQLMLAVVAEKTGYPVEMLALHMELEGDLGIDSIKRVEILSAIRERAPGIPEVVPADMAALRTLGQIVEHIGRTPITETEDSEARSAESATLARGTAGAPQARDAAESAAAKPVAPAGAIRRRVLRAIEDAPVGLAMPGLGVSGPVAVTDDGGGVATQLVRKLGLHGIEAAVVDAVPQDAGSVVFLGGLRDVGDATAALAVNTEAFRAAKAVASRFTEQGGIFVTVQDTGGDFGLAGAEGDRAWLAGVAALARTAALEWPMASVRAIDIERGNRSPDDIAGAILAELLQGGVTRDVGLRANGRRVTLRDEPVAAVPGAPLREGMVWVVSGGARGVTAACLIELARMRSPRFAILGRTKREDEPDGYKGLATEFDLKRAALEQAQASGHAVTPAALGAKVAAILANREIANTLRAIEVAGAEVRYIEGDVKDVAAALDSVRATWGPIAGIIHGAGVLADKRIADKTPAQFARVFDTKVQGLRALLDATAGDPLAHVVLFSSVAARNGNPGQCDYAMANEILNKIAARERRRRGVIVKSIGWGPWEGGMVDAGLQARFRQMGVPMIPLVVGARMFVEEIESSGEAVEVLVGGEAGAGALGATAQSAPVMLEVRLHPRSHAYLSDHRIAQRPVIPVVMAIEWMARAARACRPELAVTGVRDVKVLRGIKFERWDTLGGRVLVQARQLSNGEGATIAVELRDEGGAVYYRSTIELAAAAAAPPKAADPPALDGWDATRIYDGHFLFHGPAFQTIRSVHGLGAEGACATLAGLRESGWPEEAWCTDPAALDGGLQVALLWARRRLGGAVLPMAVGACHVYAPGPVDGPVRCVVRARLADGARAVCDIAIARSDGRLVSELHAVELIVRPDAQPVDQISPGV